MFPNALLLGGVLCAAGLLVLIQPHAARMRPVGFAAAFAGLAILLAEAMGIGNDLGLSIPVLVAVLAAVLSVVSAARVIANPRPVLAAVFFVLVVLAGAAMFLLLAAEFLAFALIIVYGGAILITYMFVLMLAHQSDGGSGQHAGADYDRNPREPIASVMVGFVLFLALGGAIWNATDGFDPAKSERIASTRSWEGLHKMPKALTEAVRAVDESATIAQGPDGFKVESGRAFVQVNDGPNTPVRTIELPSTLAPTNPQSVGLALVSTFPVSLELAGVILLMAMLGAVVLARRQIDLGMEDHA
ncbi:MAG: NADH-quinone oxidoreductase subunit J [Planctomycetota bacterium]|nr:NADH-quinone oxidoreductase subunit J [Planctomycetota bacterium]